MMKSWVTLAVISFLLRPGFVSLNADPPVPEGKSLRSIVNENYEPGTVLIGATTGSWAFGRDLGSVLDREFSYVTPEDDFKHAVIYRNPASWNWSRADAWLPHIVEHGQVLRMHCPISP